LRVGSRMGIRIQPASKDPFYFDDGICASSISIRYVLPIMKVCRALPIIIEHHTFPEFVRWSDPIPAEK
jgi:hypothetical protein